MEEDNTLAFLRLFETFPFVRVDTHLAKRVAGLSSILGDLHLGREALEQIAQSSDNEEDCRAVHALWFFAVSNYAKCFVSAKGRATVLNVTKVFRSATPDIKERHAQVMSIRHSRVAHADGEDTTVILFLNPDDGERSIREVRIAQAYQIAPADNEIEGILANINFLEERVNDDLSKAQKRLRDWISDQSMDFWYSEAMYPERTSESGEN